MLDTFSYIDDLNKSGFTNVLGTLRKTYHNSIFISFDINSPWEGTIFCAKPHINLKMDGDAMTCSHKITVLQVMVVQSKYICEVYIDPTEDKEVKEWKSN